MENKDLYEKALKYTANKVSLNKNEYIERLVQNEMPTLYKNNLSYRLYEAMKETESISFILTQIKNIIDNNINYNLSFESENYLKNAINKIHDFSSNIHKKLIDIDYTNKR